MATTNMRGRWVELIRPQDDIPEKSLGIVIACYGEQDFLVRVRFDNGQQRLIYRERLNLIDDDWLATISRTATLQPSN